jgi:GT2 family glycosyltransferase
VAEQPALSIVVSSYTVERLSDICELLDSIKVQTYPNIETIFVAESSQELLSTIITYANERNIQNLEVIFNEGEPGLSAARNLGIKQAKGDIIAFVDDDTILYENWAEEMVKAYKDDSVIGVTGPAFPLWQDEAMSWFPEECYWIISCTAWTGWDEVQEVRNAWGHSMSFRREAFEQCGVFDNTFGFHKGPLAEDIEFSLRVRTKTGKHIIYHPGVRLRHRVHQYRISWRFIRERSYWIGHSRRMMKRLYPQTGNVQDLLNQEHQLLKRILKRLFPSIFRNIFTNPTIAWRKLSVTMIALLFVAIGYYSPLVNPFNRDNK